jgi:hypothetical protein
MIQTVFNSQTVFVIDDAWDGTSALQADFSVVRDSQAGLTKREARRPYSATLLVSKLRYTATVCDAALRRLQGSLRALNTQPVIVPLWPVISRWADRAAVPVSGGLKIVWKEDWSQFEIFTDTEPSWPDDEDFVAPALQGFIMPTEPVMRNPDAASWSVEFTESSPAAFSLQPPATVFAPGPQPTGYNSAPLLLPFQPDFTSVTEEISVEVKRAAIGFPRDQAQTFYPQPPARSQKSSYTLNGSQLGSLLRFFQDVAAPGAVFWASSWIQIASLTNDALATDSVLHVEDTNAVNVGDYISLFSDSEVIARKVIATTANTITLDSAVGIPMTVSSTLLFQLCLARLDKPALSVKWNSPDSANFDLQWSEVPQEYIPANDETLGVTLGKLPTRVVLFQFTRDFGNGTALNYFFTSYEKDLVWNGQTWQSQNIQCGEISQSLNLEDDGVEITTFKFDGNPLIDDVTRRAEAPLSATIYFADFDGVNVSNVQTVFTGDASTPSRQGNILKVKCKMGSSLLDTQLPFFIRGVRCNHLRGSNADGSFLISAGCTLLKANWKFTAQVTPPLFAIFPFTLNLTDLARATGANPAFFANWFAPGVIEWGNGAAIQRRAIIGSTVPVAGAFAVTLHRYFNGVPNIGDTVVLYPGCDGIYTTCKAYDAANNPTGKFDNFPNFGGEPFTPVANPSVTGQKNLGVSGGKK